VVEVSPPLGCGATETGCLLGAAVSVVEDDAFPWTRGPWFGGGSVPWGGTVVVEVDALLVACWLGGVEESVSAGGCVGVGCGWFVAAFSACATFAVRDCSSMCASLSAVDCSSVRCTPMLLSRLSSAMALSSATPLLIESCRLSSSSLGEDMADVVS
jgi:hypothetical protein